MIECRRSTALADARLARSDARVGAVRVESATTSVGGSSALAWVVIVGVVGIIGVSLYLQATGRLPPSYPYHYTPYPYPYY